MVSMSVFQTERTSSNLVSRSNQLGEAMKPRNHVVLALLKSKRKQGAHSKSFKAMRRIEKVKLIREYSSIG